MSQEAIPAIEGWFTQGETPHLLGSSCTKCGTYFFPKSVSYCKNPACDSDEFEEVELSRTARIWSFTNGCYEPPKPYMAPDPFVPYTMIAAELAREKLYEFAFIALPLKIRGATASMVDPVAAI